GRERHRLLHDGDSVYQINSVAFSPNGKTLAATAANDPMVRLWDVAAGIERRRLTTSSKSFHSFSTVCFSPDGKTVAGSRQGEIVLWKAATGKVVRLLQTHLGAPIASLAFSRDGRTLASGDEDGRVCLWEVATGREILPTRGHAGGVWSLAFSPDGKTLAS